jgi:hypothetical protein
MIGKHYGKQNMAVTCHLLPVTCYLPVTCHLLAVTCYLPVTCQPS